MRKLVIGLFIVGLLALGLAPIAGGFIAEREYQKAAREVGMLTPAPGVRVTLDPNLFERGLTSSKAWTTVEFGNSSRMVLQHEIHHGPISFSNLSEGLVLTVIESVIDPNKLPQGQESPIRIRSVIGFDGNVHIELEGTPTNTDAFRFDGAKGDIYITKRGQAIQGMIEVAGYETSEAAEPRVKLAKTRLDLDLSSSDVGLPLGDALYSVSELEVVRNGQTAHVEDVKVQQKSELDAENKRVGTTLQLRFGQVELPDRSYSDGDFELHVRNVDSDALAELQAQRAAGVSNMQMRKAIEASLPALLAAAPEVELSTAKVLTQSGPFELYAKLSGRPEMANMPLSSGVAALAMFNLDARADVSAEQWKVAMLQAAQVQFGMAGMPVTTEGLESAAYSLTQQLLQAGYLTASNDGDSTRYQTELSLSNGAIRVNGETFNPMLFMGGASSGLESSE